MAETLAKLIANGVFGPRDAFVTGAQRSFPVGRQGASKYRAEFDSIVADCASRFASRLAQLGQLTANTGQPAAPQNSSGSAPATLRDLLASLASSHQPDISAPVLPLPGSFVQSAHVFIQAFGLGVTKHLLKYQQPGRSAERKGVKLHFGANGSKDSIEFRGAKRHEVETFLRLILA